MRERRFGSGFTIICDGMPPCDTIVGGFDVDGKGTNVWRPLDVWVGRPSETVDQSLDHPIQWMARRKGGA